MSTDAPPASPAPLAALLRSHPEAAFDYLEFRLIVAGMAARMAAERATEDDRAALTRAFQAVAAAHGADDPGDEAEADAEFHLAIYAASHNTVMQHIMRSVFQLLRHDTFYDRRRLYRREGVRELLLRQRRLAGKPDVRTAAGSVPAPHRPRQSGRRQRGVRRPLKAPQPLRSCGRRGRPAG